MYDVIVIGARCAGSPTAMLLARKGHRVLLLDRATFPSDTYSTHFVQLPGIARMKRWGVLDRVMATGCPPVTKGILDIDGQKVEAEFPLVEGLPGLAAPRRTVLDKILVDAAAEAGAEVREGAMVDSLLFDGDRVVGVQGHTSSGSFEENARIVIGADGRSSATARAVGADYVEFTPALGGGYYSYWSGVECDAAELFLYDGQFSVAFPTNDGLTTIAMAVRPENYSEERSDADGHVMRLLDRLGDFGERVRAGERVHDLISIGNLTNFLRVSHGPGWALVGDAAYHKDPTPADGISDAFRGVDLLVEAVDDLLHGRPEEEALSVYQEQFEASARPMLEKTLTMSSFDEDSSVRATAFLELTGMHLDETMAIMDSNEGVPA